MLCLYPSNMGVGSLGESGEARVWQPPHPQLLPASVMSPVGLVSAGRWVCPAATTCRNMMMASVGRQNSSWGWEPWVSQASHIP